LKEINNFFWKDKLFVLIYYLDASKRAEAVLNNNTRQIKQPGLEK
jgi:hypothetical protein